VVCCYLSPCSIQTIPSVSILDFIWAGSINKKFIEPSFELAETFAGYVSKIMPLGTTASVQIEWKNIDFDG